MIHGPDLSVVRDAAKKQVMRFYVGIAENDGTPPTLRAMYVLKTAEARTVLAGGASSMIEAEAKLRDITSSELATTIVALAGQSEALELARMEKNVALDAAPDESAVQAILASIGLELSLKPADG